MPEPDSIPYLVGTGVVLAYIIGLLHVIHALMTVRTAQGTIAWMVSLIAMPWVAVPLYWIAGRSKFSGYVRARRGEDAELRKLAEDMHRRLRHYEIKPEDAFGKAPLFHRSGGSTFRSLGITSAIFCCTAAMSAVSSTTI